MNSFPHVPTADPLALPGPEPILHGFLLIGFFLHALFMNLVLGGAPIMVVTDWLGYGTDRERYRRLGTALANMLPSFLVVAVVLGVASLLFVQAVIRPPCCIPPCSLSAICGSRSLVPSFLGIMGCMPINIGECG